MNRKTIKFSIERKIRRIKSKIYRWKYSVLKRPPQYKRKAVFSLAEVFSFNEDYHVFNGEKVSLKNLRMKRFFADFKKKKKIVCPVCGLKASFFALEKMKNDSTPYWHLNLYGVDEINMQRMFTIDHIIPVSRGGSKKSMKNLESMCEICNHSKDNKIINGKKGKRTQK